MTMQTVDVFTPGRVCLFGEHSDWAGAYRRFNSAIPPGEVIIAGTNQGLRARARVSDRGFHARGKSLLKILPRQTDPHSGDRFF